MRNNKLDARAQLFETFLQNHKAALSACQEIIKPLKSVLERSEFYELPLVNSIVTRVKSGMIFHTPVPLGNKVTKKDLESQSHIVGILANTVPLIDSVRRKALEPGPYVVQLRPLLEGGFAFDFVDENFNVALSTRAISTDPGRFEALPEDALALTKSKSLIDASIGPDICFGPATIEPIGTGPTFPDFPPFPGPEWDCPTTTICISFLYWELCVAVPNLFS